MKSTLWILLFLTLVYACLQAGFQCNINNCQTCSYPNICGLCQNNNLLTLNVSSGNFYCNPVTCTTNCLTCYQNNTCQACISGFFLTANGSCSTSSTSNTSLANCLWGNNNNCSLCSYGYILKSGNCYPIIQVTANDPNCLVKMTSSICQICQSSFIVNFLGKCVQNTQLNTVCNVANCAFSTSTNSTCLICNQGYQLTSSGSCQTPQCRINGCSVCANSNQCQNCASGYILTASKICQQIGLGCNIPNCQICSASQSCGQCSLGYQLTQLTYGSTTVYSCKKLACPFNVTNCNACIQNYNSIFQYNQILCAVNSCMNGFINVNGYCVANLLSTPNICNSISNCLSCSYPNFCSQCGSGYSLTRYGTCQINVCNVQNCQSCSVNNICQQCNSGYSLTIGNLSIFQPSDLINFGSYILLQQCTFNTNIQCIVSNCQYCLNNNVCAMCSSGYDFDASGNNCIATCNVASCFTCAQTQNVTTAACIACKNGYTLGSNGMQCNSISFNCGTGCSNSTGSCGYNPTTNSGECFQCNQNMLLYNGQCYSSTCNIYGCDICAPWAPQSTLCLKCQQSLILIDGYCMQENCYDSVSNCVNCIEGGKCVGCKVGFYLQNNSNGNVTCVASSSISNCNIENCLQCVAGNPNKCQQCATPYKISNGQCVCGFQNCLDCSTSALTCNLCPAPLFASLQDPNCVPQPSLIHTCNVNNCQACFTSNQCSLCAIGYQLNTNDYSCSINNCSALGLSNCQLCDEFGYACHVCNTGFMIDNFLEGGQCYQINIGYTCNISGCSVCSSSNNSICSACLPTYFLTNLTTCTPYSCNVTNCYLCLMNNTCTVCDTGYYLALDLSCQPKFTSIINCNNSITFCDICVSGLYNSVNVNFCIKCQNGFQFNSVSNLCVPQTNSIQNCKVQLPNYNLNNLPLCIVCQQGYFVNSYGLCSSYNPSINNTGCSVYNCLYCSQDSSTCSFCFTPWGVSSNGLCQTNITGLCNNISNCQSCLNSTYCVTCVATFLPNQGSCILCNIAGCNSCQQPNVCSNCLSNYNLLGGICISCNIPNCNSCSNNNVCSNCTSTSTITYSPSSIGSACVQCNLTNCLSCSQDNVCGICNNGYQIYSSVTQSAICLTCNVTNCLTCNANNYCSNCAQGYNIYQGTCKSCIYPCQTCNPDGSCFTCVTPLYAPTPATNGSCFASTVPNCIAYNLSNTALCTQCNSITTLNQNSSTCILICNSICSTCDTNNPNMCLSCGSGFYLANNTCNQCQIAGCSSCNATACLSCMAGFYAFSSTQCKSCPGYCSQCTAANSCQMLTQNNQQVLINSGSQTMLAVCPQGCVTCSNVNPSICLTCSDGLYLSNNVCQPCNQLCRTCSSSNPNQCLTCYPNTFITGNSCTACSSNCQSCQSASNSSTCISCYPGFYLNSTQGCTQGCSLNCLTCSSPTVCTQCSSGYTLFQQTSNSSPQTLCAPCTTNCRACAQGMPASCLSCGVGFYLSGSSCVACTPNCQSCTSAGCSSCINGFFLTSSQTCSVNCQVPCATCSSNNPTKCSSCIAGYNYMSTSFSCQAQTTCSGACSVCPIGYILQIGKCNQCSALNCQICNSQNLNQCLSCAPGFFLNPISNSCQPCLSSCSTCINGDGCLTCAGGYTSLQNVNIGVNGYQCVACTYPCITCTNTPNYCTSCASGYTFTGWKCTQSFSFIFTLTLNTNQTVFNKNYYSLVTNLASSIGSSNPNLITIIGITFGSVIIDGGVAPTAISGTLAANQQYSSLQSTLSQNSNIAGMSVSSSTISIIGGSIDYSKINLALILGICIPVGVLLISGVSIFIYCKRRKSNQIVEQRVKEEAGYTVRQSFTLSTNYREEANSYREGDHSFRPFEINTGIN